MKLFKISQTQNERYDIYEAAVVRCENEEEARNMNPADGSPMDWTEDIGWTGWCSGPEYVKVEHLGECASGSPAGVILVSFNAG